MFSIKMLILVVFIVFFFWLEKFARRKWSIQEKTYANRYVNDVHKWIDIGLTAFYLLTALTCIFVFENFMLSFYMMIAFLVTQWSVRTWIEWKYNRKSKEYLITIGGMVGAFMIVFLMKYLFFS